MRDAHVPASSRLVHHMSDFQSSHTKPQVKHTVSMTEHTRKCLQITFYINTQMGDADIRSMYS